MKKTFADPLPVILRCWLSRFLLRKPGPMAAVRWQAGKCSAVPANGGFYDIFPQRGDGSHVHAMPAGILPGGLHPPTLMNVKNILRLASCVLPFALGQAAPASVPMTPAPADHAMRGGLLGGHFSGVDFGYIERNKSAPRVMQRYGFVARQPLPEGRDLDGIFAYHYTRGSTLGPDGNQNEILAGVAVFRRNGPVAPYFETDLGWAWAKAGGSRENSFVYQFRLGVETMLSPRASLAPVVSYRAAPRFHEHAWQFGVRAAFRLNPGWSTTVALQLDDEHSVETSFGLQRRY